MSLKSRRQTLIAAVILSVAASLIGLMAVILQNGRNASTVLTPVALTTALFLGLRQVRRVELGEEVEDEGQARLWARITPWLAVVAVVLVLFAIVSLVIVAGVSKP